MWWGVLTNDAEQKMLKKNQKDVTVTADTGEKSDQTRKTDGNKAH